MILDNYIICVCSLIIYSAMWMFTPTEKNVEFLPLLMGKIKYIILLCHSRIVCLVMIMTRVQSNTNAIIGFVREW